MAARVNRGRVIVKPDCARLPPWLNRLPHTLSSSRPRQMSNARLALLGSGRDWPKRTRTLPQAAIFQAKKPRLGSSERWLKLKRRSSAKAIEGPLPTGHFRYRSRRSGVGASLVASTRQRVPRASSLPGDSGGHSGPENIASSLAIRRSPRSPRTASRRSQTILSHRHRRPPGQDHAYLRSLSRPRRSLTQHPRHALRRRQLEHAHQGRPRLAVGHPVHLPRPPVALEGLNGQPRR